jgi:ParB family chromosome partitioning protein
VARSTVSSTAHAAPKRVQHDKPRDLQRIEQRLSDALAAHVDIRIKKRTKHGEQGELAIAFGSLEELNGLLQRLGLEQH